MLKACTYVLCMQGTLKRLGLDSSDASARAMIQYARSSLMDCFVHARSVSGLPEGSGIDVEEK